MTIKLNVVAPDINSFVNLCRSAFRLEIYLLYLMVLCIPREWLWRFDDHGLDATRGLLEDGAICYRPGDYFSLSMRANVANTDAI